MVFSMKKYTVAFFLLIMIFITASNQKIPNIMILDNPSKEVTTVEGVKNREAGEVNIKVKKRDVEEIEGYESPDGVDYVLPDGIFLANEEIKVIKSLTNISAITSKSKRGRRGIDSIETPYTLVEIEEKKIVKIPKEEAENINYIIKIDKNSNEINKIYKGKARGHYREFETHIGADSAINITNAKLNKSYIFDKNLLPGEHKSSDNLVTINIQNNNSGQLPKTSGVKKANIVTDLIVERGGIETNISGTTYMSPQKKYSISLNPQGNIEVIKLKEVSEKIEDILKIKYLYKGIQLGMFTLEISNRSSFFEIIGDDIIDFGSIQGQNTKIEGNMTIKNLDSKKILNVKLNNKKPIKILKKDDNSVELPVVGDVSLVKKGAEVPIKVNLIASPRVDQPVGDYEGELELYIYIE